MLQSTISEGISNHPLKTRVLPQVQEADAMSSSELWDTVYGCAENGAVRPQTMTNFFFEVLHQTLDEAEMAARDGDCQSTSEKLRELQARCERLIQLFQPIEANPSLRRVV